uniref:Site-specific tyrosine recombinase XerC n=1 Tax=Candidatus Berkiella aquae TaxID=295108 RepID=A0A0Q9YK53_9GAMM
MVPNKTDITLKNDVFLDKIALDNVYIKAATSDNTRKAYQQDIRHFMANGGLLPSNTGNLLQYLQNQAGALKSETLQRRLTAIKHWHIYQGFADPTLHPMIRKTLRGIARIHGKPVEKAAALSIHDLKSVASFLHNRKSLRDHRDIALILIGFFGAFRRSELAKLQWEQIQFLEEGMTILIPRSKTDQTGEGQICAIPYVKGDICPVNALQHWQQAVGLSSGPVFRAINKHQQIQQDCLTPLSINHILKRVAREANLPDPDRYSAHSLRRGFATMASKKGVSLTAIMHHGRWRHEGTVYGYIEEGQRFTDNPINKLLAE